MTSIIDEHLDYLSLEGRLALYDRAMAQVVKEGHVVADLGCGVGVLGLLALRAGAARAYGIEQSPAIELARETMRREGLADRYHCIRQSTFECVLPEPVDVILCDHVGYFGFDYGIIPLLEDATRRMLKPGGTIMPRRLRLVVAGASSATARDRIDAWGRPPVPPEFGWIGETAANRPQVFDFSSDEILTAPCTVAEIDLTAPGELDLSASLQLDAATDCRIDGLACWFDCELAEGVWMTNSPLDPAAVNRANLFLAFRQPVLLAQGQKLDVTIRIKPALSYIGWTVTAPDGARQKLSTWNGELEKSDASHVADDIPVASGPLTEVQAAVLGLVNGQRTTAAIEATILDRFGGLFPTEAALQRFVRRVLALGGKR